MGPLSSLRGRLTQGRLGVWLAGMAASLAVLLGAQALSSEAITQLEDRVSDFAWRLSADKAPERRIILVDIDERSLREVGAWPWSRETQARLMDQLAAAGARRQVWDLVFEGPGAAPTPERAAQANQALATAIERHRPVLGQILPVQGQGSNAANPIRQGQPAGELAGVSCGEGSPFPRGEGYLANHPSLVAGTAPSVGHITPRLSADGIVRAQPAVICLEGRAYPALSLASFQQQGPGTGAALRTGGWLEAPYTLSITPEMPAVPLSRSGDLTIPWRQHPEGYISLSASDVLAGRVPAGLVEGAWVLVGATAFSLGDRIASPHGASVAGMVTHAQLMAAWLDGRLPYRPQATPALQAAAVVLGWLLLGGLMWGRWGEENRRAAAQGTTMRDAGTSVVWLPVAAVLSVPLLLAFSVLLLLGPGWQVGWFLPALALFTAGLTMGALAHARSRGDRDRLYTHLSSYLPAPVAAVLAGQRPSDRIEASSRQVSVMFADIRNFSAYCEARPPEEAAAVLHAFFAVAHKVVQAHGGVLEALQGDSVVATWNAEVEGNPAAGAQGGPLQHAQQPQHAGHALQALTAGRELLASMAAVLPDPAPAGLEPLALGIGLETGPAMTGSIGPSNRRTHMVMGRTVTIASRLVDMTAELAHPILVGEGMAAQLGGQFGGQRLQSLGTFILEGLRVPHHIYAPPLAQLMGAASASASASASTANAAASSTQATEPVAPNSPERGWRPPAERREDPPSQLH